MLFREGIDLPQKVFVINKVIESGSGHTLSGEPLDINSAAARPYLKGWVNPNPTSNETPKSADNDEVNKIDCATNIEKQKSSTKKRAPKKIQKEKSDSESDVADQEPTVYAKNRPTRERKSKIDLISTALLGSL